MKRREKETRSEVRKVKAGSVPHSSPSHSPLHYNARQPRRHYTSFAHFHIKLFPPCTPNDHYPGLVFTLNDSETLIVFYELVRYATPSLPYTFLEFTVVIKCYVIHKIFLKVVP